MKKLILVIEDDKDINEMLKRLLSSNGYETLNAYSGTEGVLLHNSNVDLILLDLMLPGKNGEEIIEELREKGNVPIIVMSAIDDADKKVDLFDLGADDYVTKPFNNKELLARIKVQLKRTLISKYETHFNEGCPLGYKGNSRNPVILRHKDIEMNTTDYTVTCNAKELTLTKKEFELLKVLMEHPEQVLTKSMLFDLVWGDEDSADDNTLNVHISKVRNKLKECNPGDSYIETIWSIGYKMKK